MAKELQLRIVSQCRQIELALPRTMQTYPIWGLRWQHCRSVRTPPPRVLGHQTAAVECIAAIHESTAGCPDWPKCGINGPRGGLSGKRLTLPAGFMARRMPVIADQCPIPGHPSESVRRPQRCPVPTAWEARRERQPGPPGTAGSNARSARAGHRRGGRG